MCETSLRPCSAVFQGVVHRQPTTHLRRPDWNSKTNSLIITSGGGFKDLRCGAVIYLNKLRTFNFHCWFGCLPVWTISFILPKANNTCFPGSLGLSPRSLLWQGQADHHDSASAKLFLSQQARFPDSAVFGEEVSGFCNCVHFIGSFGDGVGCSKTLFLDF